MSISKIKEIKIREEDGSYSEPIPIGADIVNIDNGEETLDVTLNTLNAKIAKSSEPPRMVDSMNEMIDTNKMYVYSQSGTIYYYQESKNTWIDSKITYVPNLVSYLGRKTTNQVYPADCSETGYYYLGSATEKPTGWPSEVNAGQILHFEGTTYQQTWELLIPYGNGNSDEVKCLYFRSKDYQNGAYYPWAKIDASTEHFLSQIKNFRIMGIYRDSQDSLGTIFTQEEFDNATNGIYFLSSSHRVNGYPFPAGLLICATASIYTQHETKTYQIAIPYEGTTVQNYNVKIRNRINKENNWTSWRNVFNLPEVEKDNTIQYDSSIDSYYIKFGDAACQFRHQTGTQWDIYHPMEFSLRGIKFSAFSGQDFTGPIREQGAADFVSGVHGDEIDTKMIIYADGKEINKDTLATNIIEFNSLAIYKESNVYSDTDKTQLIANRFLHYIFTKNKLNIHNKFKFVKEVTISNSCVTGLGSVYDDCMQGQWMNGIAEMYDTSQVYPSSHDNTMGRIYLNNGILEIRCIEGWTETSRGYIAHFINEPRPRHKIYLLDTTPHTYNTGDVLKGASEIQFY